MNKIVALFIRLYRIFRKKDLPFLAAMRITKQKYGNPGAEWIICPKYLSAEPVVFSFGIGTDISFDLALIEHHNANVFAFDPTPESITWLKNQDLPEKFHYYPYGLAHENGSAKFFVPAKENHISHSIYQDIPDSHKYIDVEMRKLNTLLKTTGEKRIEILKMDIEGAEYDVIDDILQLESPPKQLLVEFHHRFKSVGLNKTSDAVHKILGAGYKIAHISSIGEEYSFLRINE